MGIFASCPACGSDWCTGCACVRERLEAAEARLATLAEVVRKVVASVESQRDSLRKRAIVDEHAKFSVVGALNDYAQVLRAALPPASVPTVPTDAPPLKETT